MDKWNEASCKCGSCVTTYLILTEEVEKKLNDTCPNCKTKLKIK
jgi:hypothetical protein